MCLAGLIRMPGTGNGLPRNSVQRSHAGRAGEPEGQTAAYAVGIGLTVYWTDRIRVLVSDGRAEPRDPGVPGSASEAALDSELMSM